ncbi:MAG: HAD-IC family P-type ATPase [Patescibacteria group bacterium]
MLRQAIAWHSLDLKEIKKQLATDFSNGLSEKEAQKRQKHYGKNLFEKKKKFYYLKLLWKQIKSPLIFILIIAGLITLILKEYANTTVIFIAVFINTLMGIFQEGRSSRAFEKLQASQKKYATLVREGRKKIIESSELVPGDIIEIQMGNQVPADARIIESKRLEANEAVLTGEWLPVKKDNQKSLPEKTHITDRSNMLWMGSLVTEGWGRGVVADTGFNSQVGRIAEFISGEDTVVTPLQKNTKKLAKFLSFIVVLSLLVLIILGLWRGQNFFGIFLTAVALAVSAIPEGLPVAVTVVLAIGMQKIFSKNGLLKNLDSAETLGSTSLILTDKTGTLTKAEMNVEKIITLLSEENKLKPKEHKDRLAVLEMALLATEAFIENPQDNLGEWIIRGNPMGRAIFLASLESDIQPLVLQKEHKRIDFIPFDAGRRYAASLYKKNNQESYIFVIGAPEVILQFCNKIYKKEKEIALSEPILKLLNKASLEETSKGARILAVAYRKADWDSFPREQEKKHKEIFSKMTLGGFIAFHDPLRENAKQYLQESKEASIRTVLVTGDHVETAKKIGEEVGILRKNGLVLTGDELEKMSDKELEEIIGKVDIFARVLPQQKMRISNFWQQRGEIVAMTGDGVNDAPALKHADIGIALGSGTEVAKEASDLILLNDSFNTIVEAVKEGRRIMDNLRKIITYLLSTSFSEIVLVASSILVGAPLPILPAQILWVNIIEEGFMNFAFAFEQAEENILKRDPKKECSRAILTTRIKKMILIIVAITSLLLISVFFFLDYKNYPLEKVRTVMFGAMAIDAIFFSFSLKNLRKPVWKINIFSNIYLLFSLSVSIFLLLSVLFIPFLQKLLSVVSLSFLELMIIFIIGFLNLLTIETVKYFVFRKQ